ncbi:6-carboxytetrahydropterin synthase [Dissulfurirhabdus thermomarina]|uniref:6-carboxy-5,6,7,8-tetrahydropterin synthase n=1 Tax=Dissulfurirhabdus thermomarina TaxID=1765737 RepID=A0A6N9TNB9_DISTH|nr:6-carboxytetrahydropterin synthase [Dissulfurirhabdus thermomarina]NDY41930.1 6-carboxytetrahydropterin synthase [Dissulfurirhabdus thermomarina]
MYTVCVIREFRARHHLSGGDWGGENRPHAHAYRLEVRVSGPELDAHGFLVDVTVVEAALDDLLRRYEGALLNELPEFGGRNPTMERLARAVCRRVAACLPGGPGWRVRARVWESDRAWAEHALGGARSDG